MKQYKCKFELEQEVYCINIGVVDKIKIKEILISKKGKQYIFNSQSLTGEPLIFRESELFTTEKEATLHLINEYERKLKCEEMDVTISYYKKKIAELKAKIEIKG